MDFVTSSLLIILVIFLLNKYFLNFWKRHGFHQLEGSFLFGNIKDLILCQKSFANCFIELYEKTKKYKLVGVYFSYKSALLINNPEIVQDVLITHFNHFTDRGRFYDEHNDPTSNHLFNIGGQKWRDLRVKFTPTFTSGKLKAMFPIMRDCGRDMQNFLLTSPENVFNFVDLFGMLTTNIIVSTAFGVENNCFSDSENVFRKMSSSFSEASKKQHLIDIISILMPKILEMLTNCGVKSINPKFTAFVYPFVEKVVKYREENNFVRNDAMQMLIELKNQGYLSIDKKEMQKNQEKLARKISFDEMVAQVSFNEFPDILKIKFL
jgi:cytochrome P450 family 6